MAGSASDLSPQILSDLQAAERGRSLLGAAGLPLQVWEACCLAFSDRDLLLREVARLSVQGRRPDPEIVERIRDLRNRSEVLISHLRDFIESDPRDPEAAERREMMLGFIAGSPAARVSAERWVCDPAGSREEAAPKLEVIGELVERYRLALRAAARSPSGLRAVPGNGSVELSWEPVPGATGYVLKRAAGSDGAYVPVALPADPRFTDRGVSNGTAYRYAVASVIGQAESAPGSPVEATPFAVAAPAPPSGVHAIAADGKVSLAWNPSDQATLYRVFRAPANSGPYVQVGEPSEPWWTDGPISAGASLTYSIVAVSPAGESAPSTPVSVAFSAGPPPPAGLDVNLKNGEVELLWIPSAGAQAYTVLRAPSVDGPWQSIARSLKPTYRDTGLTNGVAYYYSVVALGPDGGSGRSDPVRAVPYALPAPQRAWGPPPPSPPGPPGRLMAVPGDAQVLLRWTPGRNAAAHAILRASPGEPPVEISRPESTMYLDAGLRNGATYVYLVRALNSAGVAADSSPVEATPQGPEIVSTPAPVAAPPRIEPPSSPEGLSGVPGNAQVALAWEPAPRASLYRIERAGSARGPFTECATSVSPAWTETGLANGQSCAFRVIALNEGGASGPSDVVAAVPVAPPPPPPKVEAPPPPEALEAACGNAQVTLTWEFSPRATLYRIERASSPRGRFSERATLSAPPWTETGLENGRRYVFRVVAINEGGESAPSEAASAVPVAPPPKVAPPATPTGVAAACGNGQVTLTWELSPRATLYRIGRGPTAEGPFAECATLSAPPWTETGLENGIPVAFRVVALNEGGESGPSEAAIAVPVAPPPKILPPPAPTGVAVTCGDGQVALAWEAAPGAALYRIERAASPAGPFAERARLSAPPWTETGLENGTAYVFRILALNEGGESPASEPVVAVPVAPPPKVVAPPAPSGVVAVPGHAQVTLTWDFAARATLYRIERGASPDGPFRECAALSAPPWTETGLENGTPCAFRVVASNEGGKSPPSPAVTATPVAPAPKVAPPSRPQGLTVTCGNAQVALAWEPAPGATLYRIERAASADGPFAECATATGPAFTAVGLENGRTYSFRIVAMNDGGESAPSAPAAAEPLAPPPAPTGLKGRHGDGRVTIQWDPAPGATHYRLKRATDRSGPWDTIATTPRTTFADTGLTNGTTYFYMVRAANAGGKSAYSARLRATPLAPPAAPADLRAEVGDGEVTLSWSALPGALKYLVKRAAAPEGPFATVGRPSEPTFVDRGLRNRTVYYYSVSAVGATGEGATATASATPMTLPGAPEELTAAPGDGKVTLTWGAVADATAYQAERSLSPEGPYETVGTPTGPTWVDAGLENGITHFYRVIARNAGGDGLPSIVVQAVPAPPPPAPGGVRVTPRPGRVELAWDGWPTAERFRVKRSERAGGPYAVVGNPVAPTYVDYGVRNGTTYHYVVTAVGQAGESAPSAETPATPVAGAPTGNENVPTLEQFDAPIVGGVALAPGVDLERLMDLRRVEQLRELFDGTGQKFEAWEVAALIAREGHQIRRTLDSLLRLKSDGESDSFEAGALALFDRILAVRAQMGSLVRRLRAYLELLGLPAHPPEAVEIALSFVVSADKSRARAETWLENPEGHRPAAAVYFRKALEIARGYLDAMGKRGPARPVRPS